MAFASPQPIRIMIVDDHPVVRHGLRSLLAGYPDMQVIGEAENGLEVLPLLGKVETDVILLDIQMKGQNGIDIARQVGRSFPQIKIIILTTYDDESYVQAALKAGVDGYLLKSVSHESLPDHIRAVIHGEKLLSPPLISTVVSTYQALIRQQAKSESGLTNQDLEILAVIATGASNKEIASRFFWSQATVKRKVQEILIKMGVSNRAQAIAEAVRKGWI